MKIYLFVNLILGGISGVGTDISYVGHSFGERLLHLDQLRKAFLLCRQLHALWECAWLPGLAAVSIVLLQSYLDRHEPALDSRPVTSRDDRL